MKQKNIVLLAANGQVGIELSIYLQTFDDVSVTAVVRSEYSATLLKKLGIDYICGNISDSEKIQNIILNADLVFDLAAPNRGFIKEIKNFYKRRLTNVFKYMKPGASFVFASTQAAFGYKEPLYPYLKYYFFPRSVYAANKRYGERLCKRYAKQYDIKVYLFRLTEVHGVMQNCTSILKERIKEGYTFKIFDVQANTIFIYELAEALLNITKNLELPGLYTMSSNHHWTWRELLQYIANEEQQELKVNVIEPPNSNISSKLNKMISFIFNILLERRDFLMANFSILSNLMPVMKQKILMSRASKQISEDKYTPQYNALTNLIGVLPGKRMKSLSNIKPFISDREKLVKQKLKNLI